MNKITLKDHTEYDFFSREVTIEGVKYILLFIYNEIGEFWTVSIQNEAREVLKTTKCVVNTDILTRDTSQLLPQVKMFFYTNSPEKECVGRFDFQSEDVILIYGI